MSKGHHNGNPKHGLSKTRLHRIWHSMYCRCYYKTTNQYKNYGGKGIKVCEEWKHIEGFINFYNWAINNGYSEELTLDRIDNSKDYCPENCRWSTPKYQSNHKTNNIIYTINGKTQTAKQWCEEYGVSQTTFNDRLNRGWDLEKAISKPVTKCGGFLYYTLNGETKLLSEWCKEYNINYQTAWKKAKNGNSIEKILKLI